MLRNVVAKALTQDPPTATGLPGNEEALKNDQAVERNPVSECKFTLAIVTQRQAPFITFNSEHNVRLNDQQNVHMKCTPYL